MRIHPSLTEARIVRAVRKDDGTGFCVVCGRKASYFCEPDLEHGTCPHKRGHEDGKNDTVYGAEQLLLLTVA